MSHFPIGCETLIATPSCWRSARLDLAPGKISPKLGVAEKEFNEPLDAIPGLGVERKRFSVAPHYRNVNENDAFGVALAVDAVAEKHRKLRRIDGKKVYELLPDIDCALRQSPEVAVGSVWAATRKRSPDLYRRRHTDEDAFRALAGWGVGILVAEQSHATAARYSLKNPEEVGRSCGPSQRIWMGSNCRQWPCSVCCFQNALEKRISRVT